MKEIEPAGQRTTRVVRRHASGSSYRVAGKKDPAAVRAIRRVRKVPLAQVFPAGVHVLSLIYEQGYSRTGYFDRGAYRSAAKP